MNIGSAIRFCRLHKRISQDTLGDAVGISVSYVSLIEHGKRDPSISLVSRIADELGIPLYALAFLADNREIDSELSMRMSYIILGVLSDDDS